MPICIRIRENHLSHHLNEGMTFNERKLAFFGGLKNFISMSSQKKTKEVRMPVRMITNAQMCGRSLSISIEVQTTLGTKHPVIESV